VNLAGAIQSLATGSYVVTRRAVSTYVDGRAVLGTTSTFDTGLAVAVPVSGRELERLPEGLRGREVYRLFTTIQLRTAVPDVSDPDLVVINGLAWEVKTDIGWFAAGGYFEYYLTKMGPRT
jgi:hypothetical protein